MHHRNNDIKATLTTNDVVSQNIIGGGTLLSKQMANNNAMNMCIK